MSSYFSSATRKIRQRSSRIPNALYNRLEPRHLLADVGGHITEDTTWNLADAPYVVVDRLYIDSGVTLTIEPGVEVIQNSNRFYINGKVIAPEVKFTGDRPLIDVYGELILSDSEFGTSENQQVDIRSSNIRFYEGSKGAVEDSSFFSGGLVQEAESVDLSLTNLTFHSRTPLHLPISKINSLQGHTFVNRAIMSTFGDISEDLRLEPVHNVHEYEMSNVTIVPDATLTIPSEVTSVDFFILSVEGELHARDTAVFGILDVTGHIDVEDVRFRPNRISLGLESTGRIVNSLLETGRIELYSADVRVDGNTFLTEEPFIVDPGLLPELYDNTFAENSRGILTANIVADTEISPFGNVSKYVWYFDDGVNIPAGTSLRINPGTEIISTYRGGNSFFVSGTLDVVDATFNSGTQNRIIVQNGGTFNLIDSTLSAGSVEFLQGGSGTIYGSTFNETDVEIDANSYATFEDNSFLENTTIASKGENTETILIRENYWGTTDLTEINARILDQIDDPSLPLIEFSPFHIDPPELTKVFGTSGDDEFVIIDSEEDILITVGGREYSFDKLLVNQVTVHGLSGADTVLVEVNSSATTFTGTLDHSQITNGDFELNLLELDHIVSESSMTDSMAILTDSVHDDSIDLSPTETKLWSDSRYSVLVRNFRNVESNSTEGNDQATFRDGEGSDVFSFDSIESRMRDSADESYSNVATNYGRVVFASQENEVADSLNFNVSQPDTTLVFKNSAGALLGNDVDFFFSGIEVVAGAADTESPMAVVFWGTEGDDILRLGNGEALFTTSKNESFRVGNYSRVNGYGSGGNDEAYVTDSAEDDSFFSYPGAAYLVANSSSYLNLFDFGKVAVTATEGGNDIAYLNGSADNERFFVQDRFSHLLGDSQEIFTDGFETVVANGSGGGDSAFFADSHDDDLIVLTPTFSSIKTGNVERRAIGFSSVNAVSQIGDDVVNISDSASDDVLYTTPSQTALTGTGYSLIANNFPKVYVTASQGDDSAVFRDSEGDDHFVARSTSGLMTSEGRIRFAVGFDSYNATSESGNDTAQLFDSADDDQLYVDPLRTTIRSVSSSYQSSAAGFENTFAYSESGLDEVFLVDTEEDDYLSAQGQALSIANSRQYWRIEGFSKVLAGAINGGTNSLQHSSLDFELSSYGDWV